MWIEEGKGWIKEEKGIMDLDREFPLFEILRLRIYSLESSESMCYLGVEKKFGEGIFCFLERER